MVTAVVTKYMQKGVEAARILLNALCAYRPGRSSTQLVHAHQCAAEDAEYSGGALFAVMDDFSKFYDACVVEVILMSMKAAGLEEEGYVEWCAEALHNRRIHIITSKGVTGAVKRLCGFIQGSSFSCIAVTFVVQVLHQVWLAGEAADEEYVFQVGLAKLATLGFCDDNNRYTRTLPAAVRAVRRFGQFSVVTGVGRSTKQAQVLLYGQLDDNNKWSDEDRKLCDAHVRVTDDGDRYIRTVAHNRAGKDGLGCVAWTNIPLVCTIACVPRPLKYLGHRDNTEMWTSVHGQAMHKKAMSRLAYINTKRNSFTAYSYLYACGVIPLHTWLALVGRTPVQLAIKLDKVANKVARAKVGLRSRGDPTHSIWLPAEAPYHGKNMHSCATRVLQEKSGSLDCLLNDDTAVCMVAGHANWVLIRRKAMEEWERILQQTVARSNRSRGDTDHQNQVLTCDAERTMPPTTGFQYAAVLEAARLGLYWRWRGNELAHRMLDELALQDPDAHAIGAHCTDESTDTAAEIFIGVGWERSGIYAMGSICEAMVLHGIEQVHRRADAYSVAARALLCEEGTWQDCERFEPGMATRVACAARRAIAQAQQDLRGTHRRLVLKKGGDVKKTEDYELTKITINHKYPL
jgi:hypothetical protein